MGRGGGQNNAYEKMGAKEVRMIAHLLGVCGGMLPQKFFFVLYPLRSFLVFF